MRRLGKYIHRQLMKIAVWAHAKVHLSRVNQRKFSQSSASRSARCPACTRVLCPACKRAARSARCTAGAYATIQQRRDLVLFVRLSITPSGEYNQVADDHIMCLLDNSLYLKSRIESFFANPEQEANFEAIWDIIAVAKLCLCGTRQRASEITVGQWSLACFPVQSRMSLPV